MIRHSSVSSRFMRRWVVGIDGSWCLRVLVLYCRENLSAPRGPRPRRLSDGNEHAPHSGTGVISSAFNNTSSNSS